MALADGYNPALRKDGGTFKRMSTAFVFPGQGSQSVGMMADLAAASPAVESTFAEASAVLGYDLWDRVSNGPAELLNATECTQPAMLVAGVATYRVWREAGGAPPDLVLGHSLGEFTALVVAGALEFRTAVELVRRRGRLMQAAIPDGAGSMAAVLGLEDAQVEQACAEVAADEVVEAVNFNAPGQVVIAGHASAVTRATARMKELGAKRAVTLPISVPCHSSLLEEAARQLRPSIDAARLGATQVEFWSPCDVAVHREPADLAALLQRQLARPVHWADAIRRIVQQGATRIIECGPGEVLTGLNRRIERGRSDVKCSALIDLAAIRQALEIASP